MALENIALENILFIDIETAPQYPEYSQLPQHFKALWDKKMERSLADGQCAGDLYTRAGIYPEFGRIICISAGYFRRNTEGETLRITSFYNSDETIILQEFAQLVNTYFGQTKHYLCAHNGKEFDFPYIARRSLVCSVPIPPCLDTRGLKPWEVRHLDTMELWRFGDYRNYTSLPLLAAVFGIPTPKDDIDGSLVADVYWVDNDIHRIANYCQKDVTAIAQLYRRYRALPLLEASAVTIVEKDSMLF